VVKYEVLILREYIFKTKDLGPLNFFTFSPTTGLILISIYIDDILIYSNTKEKYIKYIK